MKFTDLGAYLVGETVWKGDGAEILLLVGHTGKGRIKIVTCRARAGVSFAAMATFPGLCGTNYLVNQSLERPGELLRLHGLRAAESEPASTGEPTYQGYPSVGSKSRGRRCSKFRFRKIRQIFGVGKWYGYGYRMGMGIGSRVSFLC